MSRTHSDERTSRRSGGRAGAPEAHGAVEAPREAIAAAITVHKPFTLIEAALRRAPDRLLALAYVQPSPSERGRFDALLTARGWRRWLRLPARVEFSSSVVRSHALLHLVWRSRIGARAFPVMEADIAVRPAPGEATEVRFDGTYRPPGGVFGLVADRLVGGRVALSTAEAFLEDLAAALEIVTASGEGEAPGPQAASA